MLVVAVTVVTVVSLWKQQVGEEKRTSESADDPFVICLYVTDDAVSSLFLSLCFSLSLCVFLRLTDEETVAACCRSMPL